MTQLVSPYSVFDADYKSGSQFLLSEQNKLHTNPFCGEMTIFHQDPSPLWTQPSIPVNVLYRRLEDHSAQNFKGYVNTLVSFRDCIFHGR